MTYYFGFLWAAGFAIVLSACAEKSKCDTDKKCGGECWECQYSGDDYGGIPALDPAELDYTEEDVMADVEGAWVGDDIEVHVARRDSEVKVMSTVKISEACEVPPEAQETCAGMAIPVTLDVDSQHFTDSFVAVYGSTLGEGGHRPTNDDFFGLPSVSAGIAKHRSVTLIFARNVMWLQENGDGTFNPVAMRE